MSAQTVFIIRHGEKPDVGSDSGVDQAGNPDPKSLTPRGWQRAGAWAAFFAPSLGVSPALPAPGKIFASAPLGHGGSDPSGSKSRRPLETVSPLAALLGVNTDLRFSKGDEAQIAAEISATSGIVLVCWQHENIPLLAGSLEPTPQGIPQNWPGDRFNIIFRLDRNGAGSPWNFQQLAPLMLDGDTSAKI